MIRNSEAGMSIFSASNKLTRNVNLEDFSVVWLDKNVNNDIDCEQTKYKLRCVIDYIQTFDNEDDCIEYVEDYYMHKIFLVVSGDVDQQFIQKVHMFDQVQSIYVFCLQKEAHEQLANNHSKVQGFFVNIDNLIDHLKCDMFACTRISSFVEYSLRNLADNNRISMFGFQFLLKILIQINYDETAICDMIDQCRSYYRGNERVQNDIDEFQQNYKPQDAVIWYTHDSFIYRLLNAAFRIQNIDIIFIFRIFIRDLYQQLEIMHMNLLELVCNPAQMTVYYGQWMTSTELDKLKKNVDRIVFMNTFLLTSIDRTFAEIYFGCRSQWSYLESVLFTIELDSEIMTQPFVGIRSKSKSTDENKILLPFGTLFQIMSINESDNHVWHVHLICVKCNQYGSEIAFEQEFLTDQRPTMDSFFRLVERMGDPTRANRYRKMNMINRKIFLHDFELHEKWNHFDKTIDKIRALSTLALFYYQIDDCEAALRNYKRCVKLICDTNSEFEQIKDIFMLMGVIYVKLHEYAHALDVFTKSLEITLNSKTKVDDEQGEILYSGISLSHGGMGDWKSALMSMEMALKIRLKNLVRGHPKVIEGYFTIGDIHLRLNHFSQAIDYFQNAINLTLGHLSENVPILVRLYASMALAYSYMNDSANASRYFYQAYQCLEKSTFTTQHPATYQYLAEVKASDDMDSALNIFARSFVVTHQDRNESFYDMYSIAHYHMSQNKYKLARRFFKKALLLHNFQNYSTMNIILCYLHLCIADMSYRTGFVMESLDNNMLAISYWNHDDNDNNYTCCTRLASCFKTVARIYANINKPERAIVNFKKALLLLDENGCNCNILAELYGFIAAAYGKKNNCDQLKIKYLKKLINIYNENRLTYDINLFHAYVCLGHAYRNLYNDDLAIVNYERAINIALQHQLDCSTDIMLVYFQLGLLHRQHLDIAFYLKDFDDNKTKIEMLRKQAIDNFQKALERMESESNDNAPYVAATHRHLSELYTEYSAQWNNNNNVDDDNDVLDDLLGNGDDAFEQLQYLVESFKQLVDNNDPES
ncbi:unnamed protein product [Rotaria sp. Silwood1]|nr:unnamed protein product [Rotaria sp. Silwood1]